MSHYTGKSIIFILQSKLIDAGHKAKLERRFLSECRVFVTDEAYKPLPIDPDPLNQVTFQIEDCYAKLMDFDLPRHECGPYRYALSHLLPLQKQLIDKRDRDANS